jgi:hypothetical protein
MAGACTRFSMVPLQPVKERIAIKRRLNAAFRVVMPSPFHQPDQQRSSNPKRFASKNYPDAGSAVPRLSTYADDGKVQVRWIKKPP